MRAGFSGSSAALTRRPDYGNSAAKPYGRSTLVRVHTTIVEHDLPGTENSGGTSIPEYVSMGLES